MKATVKSLLLVLLVPAHLGWAEINDFNWRMIDSGFPGGFSTLAFVNGLFVAGPVQASGGGDNTAILTSPDGLTWTCRDAGLSAFSGITYANRLFVSSWGGNNISTSFDLVTWTLQSSIQDVVGFYGIASGNDLFLAVGASGKSALSLDATNWITFKSGTDSIYGVAYGRGMFVTTRGGGISSTSDGISWTSSKAV